jgi:hypothetical protein
MAAGKLREAAARGNLQEVLRLIEEGAKIQSDEVSICRVSYLLHWCAVKLAIAAGFLESYETVTPILCTRQLQYYWK